MSDEALAAAIEALDVAVFEQRPDGGFSSVGPVPAWFRALGKTNTFPFLGSFLDEARAFWAEPRAAPLKWGPCGEVDETGRRWEFNVSAVSSPTHKFLIFELYPEAEEIQSMLQYAREQALVHEAAVKDLRTCARAIAALVEQLRDPNTLPPDDLLQRIVSASETLIARVDRLLEARRTSRQQSVS